MNHFQYNIMNEIVLDVIKNQLIMTSLNLSRVRHRIHTF